MLVRTRMSEQCIFHHRVKSSTLLSYYPYIPRYGALEHKISGLRISRRWLLYKICRQIRHDVHNILQKATQSKLTWTS